MRRRRLATGIGLVLALVGRPAAATAQLSLTPVKAVGQTVTPVFEGWYRNPDGSYSISFGYFNRNSEEVLDVPIGPENFVAPGGQDQGQPTHFHPRRHWGVFAVTVPADFGEKTIAWTIRIRGETFTIPGSLHPDWQIDALEGEAGTGNTPPVLKFADGSEGRGPGGIAVGPLTVRVGKPLALVVWATDDGRRAPSIAGAGRERAPVTLTWFVHQGPGDVTFTPASPPVDAADGKATATATFSAPGAYVLRVRANDASGVANAGHAQCCWTNGFVKVVVTP
ncbi:MAG TPA: hypothetical protein VFT29_05700 [Gemmatimonadaceae bacterium]|nr:hypothetical protein [Gemmatimonadaceae bacterium]